MALLVKKTSRFQHAKTRPALGTLPEIGAVVQNWTASVLRLLAKAAALVSRVSLFEARFNPTIAAAAGPTCAFSIRPTDRYPTAQHRSPQCSAGHARLFASLESLC